MLLGCGVAWITVLATWRPWFDPWFRRAKQFSGQMLASAGVCAVFVVGQMLLYLREARSLQSPGRLHVSRVVDVAQERHRPRIIWIILDELSYRQVYERRFPGLDLPAFDQLASEATSFTNVGPAALLTEAAAPSMMSGLRMDSVRANADGTLDRVHDPLTGQWRPFSPYDTVFQDALDHGFRTGVAGWYNPYCRTIPEVLDRCEWTMREAYRGGMSSDAGVWANLAASWRDIAERIVRPFSDPEEEQRRVQHISDYCDLVAAGDRLLLDPSENFVLLHMPVPHPGGVYDRRTGAFATHQASYVDNLALADRYVAHVREVLEQRGEWNSAAVLVMGDHSWRTTQIWASSPEWTAEDQQASEGGKYDGRPAYVVKLPGQRVGARYDGRFEARRTRALLDGIIEGSYQSVPELLAFAAASAPVQTAAIQAEGGGLPSQVR